MTKTTIVGLVLSTSLPILSGCPMGDCWGTADITLSVEKHFPVDSGVGIFVAEVSRIEDSDVTGTTPEGLPVGSRAAEPRLLNVRFDSATGTGSAQNDMTDQYPTWYYAFVDLNHNRQLDSGEPFGTERNNPSKSSDGLSCRSQHYQGTIVINRRLP